MHPFLQQLLKKAKKEHKTIVLAEACDERVIRAAQILYEKKTAKLILIGDEKKITRIKKRVKATFNYPIINPKKHDYTFKKTTNLDITDPHILAALLVRDNHAQGAVSGNISTTATTLRAALKVLKNKRVRAFSYFLMITPNGPKFFADCALNISPDDKLLSKIAIGTAQEAERLGVKPKIAFLSYSTHESAHGVEADLVQQAMKRTKKHYLCDELQFDAAINKQVAKQKAPKSTVAGQANIFIFPNLMAGNIGYKIAERTGGWHAIGPIVHGLKKPMNDLSRGCSVEDIVAVVEMTILQE